MSDRSQPNSAPENLDNFVIDDTTLILRHRLLFLPPGVTAYNVTTLQQRCKWNKRTITPANTM